MEVFGAYVCYVRGDNFSVVVDLDGGYWRGWLERWVSCLVMGMLVGVGWGAGCRGVRGGISQGGCWGVVGKRE